MNEHLGASWLDNVKPNWHKLIDVNTLDINLWSKCILGQVFPGEIAITVTRLHKEKYRLTSLGFDHLASKESWLDEIKKRIK